MEIANTFQAQINKACFLQLAWSPDENSFPPIAAEGFQYPQELWTAIRARASLVTLLPMEQL